MKKKGISCKSCPAFHEPCLDHGIGDNPAHIIAVGVSPSNFSIGEDKAFYGHAGRMFTKLMGIITRRQPNQKEEIKVYKTYAVLVGAHKPTIEHVQNCQSHLRRELDKIRGIEGREPVLVPLGPLALKAVGIQAKKITDVVGRVMSTTIPTMGGSRKLVVVPCLSMDHVIAKPGTAAVALSALSKAVSIACGERADENAPLATLTKDYIYPKTAAEVGELVDMILGYKDQGNVSFHKSAEFWPISVDTETNTLYPYYHENPKTLMLSVAWNAGKAATILLDHPDAGYDDEGAAAWEHVRRLLQSPKPKVFHNWKFDHKFLELTNGIQVNNVKWDTMLGEHYLEEDKRGLYSLKQLTPMYAPGYGGYDDALQEIFRGAKKDPEFLHLPDDQILTLATPEGRDPEQWEKLREWIVIRNKLRKISAKLRSVMEQSEFAESGVQIKELRGELKIKKLVKPKKEKGADGGFESIPLDVILQYAAVDADVTWVIFTKQLRRLSITKLREEGSEVMKSLYLPASRTLSRMEYRGFPVDQEHLANVTVGVEERLSAAKQVLADRFDPNLNVNAAKQVSDYMQALNFEALPGVDPGSTGKDVLAKYKEHYPEDDNRHVFCDKVLEYRECHKTLNTYLKNIRKFSAHDGKIHCTFHLNGTATGRLSSANPNLQNLPPITCRRVRNGEVEFEGFNIKKLFVPSRPGYSIANCDISGAELRVVTAYSGDEDMIAALTAGLDLHSVTTSKVYGIPYEEVMRLKELHDPDITKKRLKCKRVVFGALYGAGAYKLAEQVNCSYEEAQELQRFLFEAYPKLREYIDNTHAELQRDNQRVQTLFGRVRRFKLAALTERHAAEARREAVNFKIQSTSSDLVLSQLCEMDDHLHELDANLLVTVHDSYVLEIPTENIPKLWNFFDYWIVERIKERFPWLPVPFAYDLEAGPSYGELKEVSRDAA